MESKKTCDIDESSNDDYEFAIFDQNDAWEYGSGKRSYGCIAKRIYDYIQLLLDQLSDNESSNDGDDSSNDDDSEQNKYKKMELKWPGSSAFFCKYEWNSVDCTNMLPMLGASIPSILKEDRLGEQNCGALFSLFEKIAECSLGIRGSLHCEVSYAP